MSRALRVSEPAGAELAEAVRWYESRRPGLGVDLLDAVARALDLIEQNPEIGSPMPAVAQGRLRRLVVQRFPYQVIYEVTPAEVAVVAVAHAKRHPDYWKTRL